MLPPQKPYTAPVEANTTGTGVSQAPGDGMTDEAEPAGDEYAQGLLHLAREEIQAYTTVDGSAP